MDRLVHKIQNKSLRHKRVRSKISGTTEKPRLSVFISNKNVIAQLIDDTTGKTLAYATTVGVKSEGSMTDKAAKIGADIATKAKGKKISKVVFDRGSRIYHGRVQALADAARKNGLEF